MCAAIFAQVVLILVFITNKEEVNMILKPIPQSNIELCLNYKISLLVIDLNSWNLKLLLGSWELHILKYRRWLLFLCKFKQFPFPGKIRHIRHIYQQTEAVWRQHQRSKRNRTFRLPSESSEKIALISIKPWRKIEILGRNRLTALVFENSSHDAEIVLVALLFLKLVFDDSSWHYFIVDMLF